MSSLASAPLAGALRARLPAKSPASTGSTRAATVRPARASARDEEGEGARDPTPERALARFVVAAAASVAVALPAHAAAPVAQVALSVDEQIAAEVSKYDAMKASCKNEACRTTTQSWEDAAVKKIKKKNGVAVEKPKGQAYPAAPRTAAPAPKIEPTAPAEAPPAAPAAPAPKAETPPAEAKAEAKARLAERQAASAAAAEAAAAEKAAKAAAAKQAAEDAAAEKAAAIKAKAAEAEAAKQAKAAAKEAPSRRRRRRRRPPLRGCARRQEGCARRQEGARPEAVGVARGRRARRRRGARARGRRGHRAGEALREGQGAGRRRAAALDEAKAFVASTEGVVGKAAAAAAIVAADAAAHLPVLGFLLPGPLEYVGACAAALLAARYYVTKDATAEEDLAALGARLPSDVPAAEDVVAPARAVANSLKTFASDFDFDVTKGDITEWFNGLEDPVETIAPPAAALFVANLIVYAAHVPVFNVAAPRALELAGVAVALAAVEKYGASDGSARFQEDLGRYARQGGDAVKQLIEK